MTEKTAALAAMLLAARRDGQPIADLPAELVPATAAEAYAVQDRVTSALGPIAGWKVGAGSPPATPNCAPLLADLVAPSPARWPAARFRRRGVEAELAFRFAIALKPRARPYGEDEVWDAVASLHPAIEVVESRFALFPAFDPLALLADHQSNGAFCYGAAAEDWRDVDFLSQPARLLIDGKEAARARGGNAAGHPRRLLAWLANHRARSGDGIADGDIVTTGSHTGLVFAPPGATVTAEFDGIGSATLAFAASAGA
ncbi:MAG TPA: fumarylacetoacetate hydrolase family protein [Stellaceae bacterium]|jgi:2-keto-4-pentenoate hydratase|nr:fumarylacetoacetate hydrolase family protein [Stellaceae bacterium]